MSIRQWPGAERPREKLLERGAHALSDAELVALLLGSGTRGRSAVELARTTGSGISQFGAGWRR
jgi:DNA repair protein RadC